MGLPAESVFDREREVAEILAFLRSLLTPKLVAEAEAVDFELTESVWFRLPPGLLRGIDLLAEIEGRTRAATMRMLLDEGLKERKLPKASGG